MIGLRCGSCDFVSDDRNSFIDVEGHFTTEINYDRWNPAETKRVYLAGCPKCGTVRIANLEEVSE